MYDGFYLNKNGSECQIKKDSGGGGGGMGVNGQTLIVFDLQTLYAIYLFVCLQ